MFACLKGRGFRFESTRVTNQERIETMVAVLAIAFAWAHKVSDWRDAEQKPITVKKHGRLTVSFFRYGLDWIRQTLVGITAKPKQLAQCLEVFINSWLNLQSSIRLGDF